jgi:Subtilase family
LSTFFSLGFKGQGVVVGISSYGVFVEHEALKPSYRGYNKRDGTFSHDYNWMDAFGSSVPVDPRFIGTHITGAAAGTKNGIGVAPAAKFIACRAIDDLERESPESQIKCLQWFYAPTPVSGDPTLARPDKRPHVVYTTFSDSGFGDIYMGAITKLLKVGVLVITNAAPREENTSICAKQLRAPSFYPNVLTIGALAKDGSLLSTNLVVPGGDVVSAVYLDGQSQYFAASGTPIAGVVAVGAVAVLLSARPELKNQPETIRLLLQSTANPMLSSECASPREHPNNLFGYGLINITTSYLVTTPTTPRPTPMPMTPPVPQCSQMMMGMMMGMNMCAP